MRPITPELLWIGNALDVRDIKTVLSLGIRAVIDLAASEPPVQYPRDIVYCRLPLNDGPGNDPAILRLAVQSTAEFIKARVPTLVACSAGMSRSPAVVAAAIALVENEAPDDMLRRIALAGPHDVAPGLWGEIKQEVFSVGESSERVTSEASEVTVKLTRQEALVLFEYLRRCDDEGKYAFVDQAEQRVLWNVECVVQKHLHEIFDPKYGELLKTAWAKLRDEE
jgi:hypothetical protein